MVEIIATGTIAGKEVTLVYKDGALMPADFPTYHIKLAIERVEPLGGTYYPDPYDPLNVYEAFKNRIFDSEPKITVRGDLGEIPWEPDLIY